MKRIHDIAAILRGVKIIQGACCKDIKFNNCKSCFNAYNCVNYPDKHDVLKTVRAIPRTLFDGLYLVCYEMNSVFKYKLKSECLNNSDDEMISENDMTPITPTVMKKSDKEPNQESEFDAVDKQLIADFRQQHPEILNKSNEKYPKYSDINLKTNSDQNLRKPETKVANFGQERKVPSSELGRALTFGSLFVRLGAGALSESTRRKLNWNNPNNSQINPFLSEANAKRIVDSLCKVRGAALKLGQMLSIQDSEFIHPQLQEIFERARQNADFMPVKQMNRVMVKELGDNWKEKFIEFDEKPFAAASIGQVHRAVMSNTPNKEVAVKIQYPGVKESIESDFNNLMSLLRFVSALPPGLHANKAIEVAKRELAWECDYRREAQFGSWFADKFANDSVFIVPKVISELSTEQVLTTEFVHGISLDKCVSMEQEIRDWVGSQMMRLCLKELFEFRTMQTDPNWANFLFNIEKGKIYLIDFGASREYQKSFVDDYLRVIKYASLQNKQQILKYSRKLGFLTGFETQIMEEAHINAVSILGEVFTSSLPFDFGRQSTTKRIKELIPVMLEHRLTSPPEETYSLHRKLSGGFLLCSKLKARVSCSKLFNKIYDKYKFD